MMTEFPSIGDCSSFKKQKKQCYLKDKQTKTTETRTSQTIVSAPVRSQQGDDITLPQPDSEEKK